MIWLAFLALVPGGWTSCAPRSPAAGDTVVVPAGPFWHGCNEAVDTNCYIDEKPYHLVDVPAFEIDTREVTVSTYGECVRAGACTTPGTEMSCNWSVPGREEHPINCITWAQARDVCAWAGKRLCSESEWEKASRGTDGRLYPWGNLPATSRYAVMADGAPSSKLTSTQPVGSRPAGASPYGVLDLSGNVWEWTEDDWHRTYTGAPTDGRAWVDHPRGPRRVVRGGAFDGYTHVYCGMRSSDRSDYDATTSTAVIGTRCCRSRPIEASRR